MRNNKDNIEVKKLSYLFAQYIFVKKWERGLIRRFGQLNFKRF